MAGMTMVKGKHKYMPLSEANVSPVMVSAYDGQHIYVSASHGNSSTFSSPVSASAGAPHPPSVAEPKPEIRYTMGNYLGGGIAGVVYEAFDKLHQRHVAIKMLNPVGYKLCTPSVLKRAEIIKEGVPLGASASHVVGAMLATATHAAGGGSAASISLDHVYWVKLPNKRDLVACYADGAMLRELTLEMCVALWPLDAEDDEDEDDAHQLQQHGASRSRDVPPPYHSHSPYAPLCREEMKGGGPTMLSGGAADEEDEDMMMMMMMQGCARARREEEVQVGDVVYRIPRVPAKYRAFLQGRKTIYREIAHMHKLTGNSISGQVGGGHLNVLKLFDVLELIQPSKSTIFLVLELAAGGELFDRIRAENGVDEATARGYFAQLLSGVLFCHQLGIVHRDLKPENLLLSDADVLKIADFGLSAHFIAAVSSGGTVGAGAASTAPVDDSRAGLRGHHALPELDDENESGASRVIPAARFRRLNSIVGSPHYVAPEILQNARYGYDGRKADMWSIGVILYGLLVGSLPFGKDLQTCARYLKFCEWIRSLPCDPQTGKLVYDPSIYQATPVRIHTTSATLNNAQNSTGDDGSQSSRPAQVHPNYNPPMVMGMNGPASWWSSAAQPTIKPCINESGVPSSGSLLSNGAPSGRRGSRVVSYPSWFFPSKVSPQAVFLMASLMHPEPGKRASCEDACRSSWVAGLSQ